jgi:hypothetical protein
MTFSDVGADAGAVANADEHRPPATAAPNRYGECRDGRCHHA